MALDAALSGDKGNLGGGASTAGTNAQAVGELADFLKGAEDLVIVYGERVLESPRRRAARCSTSPRGWGSPAAPAPGCSRRRPPPTPAACARPASRPATAPATRRSPSRRATPLTEAGLRRAVAAPRRPAAHPPGPRRVGGRARERPDRDRRRLGAHRHDPRARRRRLPRRGLRREGGHAHASRRARPAPAPRHRAPQGPRRAERLGRAPAVAGHRRRRRAARGSTCGSAPARSPPGMLFDAVPFYAGLTLDDDRRPRHPLADLPGGERLRGRAVGAREARGPVGRAGRLRGRAAPWHLPHAVGLQGGRRLAGAGVPAPAPGRRALARPTPSGSGSARATRSRSAPTGRA